MPSKKPADSTKSATRASAPKQYASHDGLCHFEWRGERCPLPGNQSDSVGGYGRFWCIWHRHEENRRGGIAQDEHFRLFADEACVRDFIDNNYSDPLVERRRALIKEHPEWQREAGEGKTAYVRRMRSIIEPLLGCVKRVEGAPVDV